MGKAVLTAWHCDVGSLKQKSAKNNRGHGLEFLCTGARITSLHSLFGVYEQSSVRHRCAPSLWGNSIATDRLVCPTWLCDASAFPGRGAKGWGGWSGAPTHPTPPPPP